MNSTSAEQVVQGGLPLPWQSSVWQRLREQHAAGLMAHAYLVSGEQGIGKFQLIEAFARFLLCLAPVDGLPCKSCVNCELGVNGNHPDLLLVQPEEGSKVIKIDQIRRLTEFATRTSHSGLLKLVLINQAHSLNISAANSLLKTLEEPANNTYLFLITERAESLSATLRSRCQRLLLQTPEHKIAADWLQQQGIAPAQATTLAVAAGNRPLHALTLAGSNGIADANEFLRALVALSQQQLPPQAAVTIGLKIGDAAAVEYLLRTSSIVSKALVTNSAEHSDLIGELIQTLAGVSDRKTLVRRLLRFNQETELSLRQLQGGANPNPQLLLESLLWGWSRLGVNLNGVDRAL